MKERPTHKDIAKLAKVNRSTVTLALQNHSSISAATKQRIQALARKMGYSPDPMLSALAAYRSRQRPKPFQGVLAWLVNNHDQKAYEWRAISMFDDYHKGAIKQASIHGYRVEVFAIDNKAATARQLNRTWRTRNISGLLLCPQPHSNATLDLPWENFSTITFGYTLAKPQLNKVVTSQYHSMRKTMQEVRAAGYQRIGLLYSHVNDERASHNYLAGYLTEEYLNHSNHGIPPLDSNTGDVGKWFRKYRPDAIVSASVPDGQGVVERAGIRVPDDVALAFPVLPPSLPGEVAGVAESSEHMGRVAVDLLVGMIQQSMKGIPEFVHSTTVDGVWMDGATLPRRTR